MEHMEKPLHKLLRQCTVRLSIPGRRGYGTGFFVAPDLILTCMHVLKQAIPGQTPVEVFWAGQNLQAHVVDAQAGTDIALLQLVSSQEHPCVLLQEASDPLELNELLYSYGYSETHCDGDSVITHYEGWTNDENEQMGLLKLRMGEVEPGMSGAPVLNVRTGRVCGMLRTRRIGAPDLGGRAISIDTILAVFPDIEEKQRKFHQQDHRWVKTYKSLIWLHNVQRLLKKMMDLGKGLVASDGYLVQWTKQTVDSIKAAGKNVKFLRAVIGILLIVGLVSSGISSGLISNSVRTIWSRFSSTPTPVPTPSPDSFPDLSDGRFIFDTTRHPVQEKQDATQELRSGQRKAAIADWAQALDEDPTDAETRIYWADQQILQASQPYFTLVVLVSLTTEEPNRAQLGRGLSILQGVAVAQDEFNSVNKDIKVRFLIANVSFLQATTIENVVQHIIKAQQQHIYQNIVGIVGWPFDGPKEALEQLTHAGLPVISSTPPSNELLNVQGFFSVTPSLQTEAEAAAHHISATWPGEKVLLLEDSNDPYSEQLGEAFKDAFNGDLQAQYYTVGQVCRSPDPCNILNPYLNANMVIYFAGYPEDAQFILFHARAFSHVSVVGGDVMSQLVNTANLVNSAFNGLFFTAFAFHDSMHDQHPLPFSFTQDYAKLFNPQRAYPMCFYNCVLASSDVMQGYDAALALSQTSLKVRSSQRSLLPEPMAIQSALTHLIASAVPGVTGPLAFAQNGTLYRNTVLFLWFNNQGYTQNLTLP